MRILLLLALLFPSVLVHAATSSDLVGLWGNETVSGPVLQGAVTVDGREMPWLASVGGVSAEVEQRDGWVTFAMPGEQGSFRGRLVEGNLDGFWTQPPGQTLSSAYATPLVLAGRKEKVWVGTLSPLKDRVTQYLRFERGGDDSIKAFLSNPEFNLGIGRLYDVDVDGDAVVLTDPSRKDWALNGRLDDESGQLLIDWQGIGVFPFTRRDRDHAIGYYASTPAVATSKYRVPVPADDGWTIASLDAVGMREAPMLALLQHLESLDTPQVAAPNVHGMLVARGGKLVFENYFHGYSREQAHDTRSAGKSFASLMVGMAAYHGANVTANTPVLSLFPHYENLDHSDDRKREMTVGDLVSMSAGLACDDDDSESPGSEEAMQSQQEVRDWYRYTLDLPMVQAPGSDKAVYCSAAINLLGGVVRNTTGRSITELFEEWLARPMQMRGYHLNLMPDGDAYLAGGIYMRPRDMLKLGQLYIDGGVWNGRRLIDQAWIDASVERRTTFGPNHDYGYAWHLHTFHSEGVDYRGYAAEGNGGQFVIVVPELDLVVAITGGNYRQFSLWYPLQELVSNYVIPATVQADHATKTVNENRGR